MRFLFVTYVSFGLVLNAGVSVLAAVGRATLGTDGCLHCEKLLNV